MATIINPFDLYNSGMAGTANPSQGGQGLGQGITDMQLGMHPPNIRTTDLHDMMVFVDMVDNGYIIGARDTKYIAKNMVELQEYFLSLVTAMQLDRASEK